MERRGVRNVAIIIGLLLAAFLAYRVVTGFVFGMVALLFGTLIKFGLPILIVGAIGFVVYKRLFGEKSLTGSSRGRLPRL